VQEDPLFEKSGAKTFVNQGLWRWQRNAPDPDSRKFFAAFLQKSSAFFAQVPSFSKSASVRLTDA
jgi:hypothetical protein